jgi:hypothetical protein
MHLRLQAFNFVAFFKALAATRLASEGSLSEKIILNNS